VLPNLGWVGPHPTFVGFEYDDRRRVPSVTRAVGPTRSSDADAPVSQPFGLRAETLDVVGGPKGTRTLLNAAVRGIILCVA